MSAQFSERQKVAARRAVRREIMAGRLVRPSTCSKCGATPEAPKGTARAIHAHHHDYSRPLDVEWICAKCHRAETPLPEKMGAPTPGERNGQAKLTEVDVISARRLRTTGISYQRIAARFGVDKKTIMRAIKGEQWAHVAAAPSAPQDFPGCSGDPASCPENEGYGCCKPNPSAPQEE